MKSHDRVQYRNGQRLRLWFVWIIRASVWFVLHTCVSSDVDASAHGRVDLCSCTLGPDRGAACFLAPVISMAVGEATVTTTGSDRAITAAL